MESIYSLSPLNIILLLFSGFMIGVSKTGVPGLGMLAIILSAMALPARHSTGLVLVMLICGDLFAVAYYRRHAVWKHLLRIIPWAFFGIVIGYFFLGKINDRQLKPVIALIILSILVLNHWWKNSNTEKLNIPERWWFAAFLGLLAGTTTMMANAAGPIMIIYLLAMGLPKKEFIGTSAWYFFLMNWVKVPFSANLGLINAGSMRLNFIILPAVAVGAIAGIIIMKKIPEKAFNIIVQVLTVAAALKLLF